jgi:low temperature requirement protein LtrA
LALLIGIGLWWIYFDSVSHRQPIARQSSVLAFLYLHIPLTASIAAVGAANLNVVEHAGEPLTAPVRWLLVGSVAMAMIVTAILVNLVDSGSALNSEIHIRGRNAILVSAVAVLLLGMLPIGTILTLTIIVLLLLLPVYFALRVWLSRYDELAANQPGRTP